MNYQKTDRHKIIELAERYMKDRDASHNMAHIMRVVIVMNHILESEGLIKPDDFTHACAYLHDVADPKYDLDGKYRAELTKALGDIFKPDDVKLIQDIIDRASYTHERKNGDKDWQQVLGDRGITIRNALSDADKLDAIHPICGLARCRAYAAYKLGLSEDHADVQKAVAQHVKDKLLGLKDYIRTKTARAIAEEHTKHLSA